MYPIAKEMEPTYSTKNYPISNKKVVQGNKQVFVLSIDTFNELVNKFITNIKEKKTWEKIKGKFEFGANNLANAQSILIISKLANSLSGASSQVILKYYSGSAYIIIKGTPALARKITSITGAIPAPVVTKFAIGTKQALASVKSGAVITIIAISIYRIINYFLSDTQTLAMLFSELSKDIVKVGLSGVVTSMLVKRVAYVVVFTGGPLIVAVVAGIAIGWGIGRIEAAIKYLIEKPEKEINNTIQSIADMVGMQDFSKILNQKGIM